MRLRIGQKFSEIARFPDGAHRLCLCPLFASGSDHGVRFSHTRRHCGLGPKLSKLLLTGACRNMSGSVAQVGSRSPDRQDQRLSSASEDSAPLIFNRVHKRIQKDRSVICLNTYSQTTYIKDEIAARLADRLLDIKRRFKTILDIGSGTGHIIQHIDAEMADKVIMVDMSREQLKAANDVWKLKGVTLDNDVTIEKIVGDEEELLQHVEEKSCECAMSCLSMHWINDIPGHLIQVRKALKPDSPFIAAIFGGDTLYELRTSFQLADLERRDGLSNHVSPMTEIRDLGSLLTRAGFVLPTIDSDEIVVSYPSMFELMEDLKVMGENSALVKRGSLSKDSVLAASAIYENMYAARELDQNTQTSEDGRPRSVTATFQVFYLIGWTPSRTTPKPLQRGSAQVSMKVLEQLGVNVTV